MLSQSSGEEGHIKHKHNLHECLQYHLMKRHRKKQILTHSTREVTIPNMTEKQHAKRTLTIKQLLNEVERNKKKRSRRLLHIMQKSYLIIALLLI